jgi:hypothetical protein
MISIFAIFGHHVEHSRKAQESCLYVKELGGYTQRGELCLSENKKVVAKESHHF